MGDSYGDPQKGRSFNNNRDVTRNGFRGGRGPSNRDQGGFRIRLSDNEMNAARTIQEAFNLRSTVAVLGFSIRTLSQMLEEGKLDEVIAQYRSQNPREVHELKKGDQRNSREDSNRANMSPGTKPNPFARPEKPATSSDQNNEEMKTTEHSSKEIDDQLKGHDSLNTDSNESNEDKNTNDQ